MNLGKDFQRGQADKARQLSDSDLAVWNHLVESYRIYATASQEFLAGNVNRVGLLRNAIHNQDRLYAIMMLKFLHTSEIQQLFDDLVFLASSSHGSVGAVRNAILSLPREWVLAKIEPLAEPFLQNGSSDEYRRFLELYIKLDQALAQRLALRAANQEDEDIREAGMEFLDKLNESPNNER